MKKKAMNSLKKKPSAYRRTTEKETVRQKKAPLCARKAHNTNQKYMYTHAQTDTHTAMHPLRHYI